ncbi:hypothetical protein [Leucobacter sp. L43]|uniref:hypothetical protein n=1 Tax=Leucobacter sp. L43 TaxID=2798040 RepID=UPI001905EAC2|nr:hypothetical protein [Leucobacter sp. L43]
MTSIHEGITITSPDPERTALGLSVFGLVPYSGTEELMLRGAGNGPSVMIRQGQPTVPTSAVFYGVDLYSSNAELSADLAERAGWLARRPSAYWASGRPIIESRIHREDDALTVFAAQTDPALALKTRLDDHPEELHSDIVTTVWFVEEAAVAGEVEFWTKAMGLHLFEEPAWYDARSMAQLFDLPEPRRVGGVLFADDAGTHLLEFLYLEGAGILEPNASGVTGWQSIHFIREQMPDLMDARLIGKDAAERDLWESPGGVRFTVEEAGNDAGTDTA